ncbi:unnamed protein product [Rotaria sp. Silwood1]|nr:unnamed protein product [Rotaria sp. Silwood1]CAF4811113.1 unnamed protein product [Rotaria sp. Silwood1]
MALALYVADANQFRLEAQLYAIAAIHLLVEYTTDFSLDKFNELQKLVIKMQGNDTSASKVAEHPISSTLNSGALVLHQSTVRSLAVMRRDIRTAVSDDKRRLLLRHCLPRSTNLRINTAAEGILEAKLQATKSQVSGVAVFTGGLAVTSGVSFKIYADVMTGFAAGSLVGPVGSIIGASIGLISGGVLGYLLLKKGNELCEEPLVREELNQILSDASKFYQESKIDDFFKTIAKPYSNYSKRLVKITLIEDHVELKIDAEEIVKELLSHEFRPDGIAYLLILIGEGLLKGPTISTTQHFNRLDSRTASVEAQKLFREVYSNGGLLERACFLDSKVTKIKLEDRAKYVKRMFQYFNKSVYSIPKEYFDDAITTPFTTRLSELIQIARLSYAISHLIEGDQENLKRSYTAIQRLKTDIQKAKQQQFFQISELRISALEDLLAAFGFFDETVKNLAVETRALLSIESPMSIELIDKVSTGVNSMNNCERVLGVADSAQSLSVLEELLTMASPSDKRRMSDTAPDKILSVKNLAKMADSYHTNFRLCQIQSNPSHGRIFVPTGQLITCRQSSNAPCVYLVLDDHETNIIGMFTIAEPRITYLLQQLAVAPSNADRVNLSNQIAQIFRERAEKAENQHHLLALPLWFDSLKYYTDAWHINKDPIAALGLIRCMIMLGRYTRADNTLRELLSTSMTNNGEAWYLRAVACRKQAQFEDAHYCARESLRCNYVDAQKELKLCEKLKEDKLIKRIEVYERMTTRYSIASQVKPSYNILSIDGGGCRGIIPAFWLTELERLTKRPCSSLFDMMAGTSTGAIISIGLATPATNNGEGSRYKAFDILQLYRNQASSVFALPDSYLSRLGSSFGKSARYTDNGRRELFDQYFGETRLGDLLVDTVIPAVTSASYSTRLFTNHRKSGPQPQNYQVKDILMCTTAAPTYFEPYILDSTMYVDGGVQANNPTMEAFGQALDNGVRQENIYVLSLGTGDYVPDPLHPNKSRNLLFWAANSETVVKAIFDGPQNNIDVNMSRLLADDHYHRWQVWLEKPVTLDDTSETTMNMLCDLAREQLESMEVLDSRKRLGLLIEHLRGTN